MDTTATGTAILVNSSGVATDHWFYDAWGNIVERDGATVNTYRYTGQQQDGTGLYYLRARYYDPAKGRFGGRDPVAGNNREPGSLHKYAYCANDPANRRDPTGLQESLVETMTVQAIIGFLVNFDTTLIFGAGKDPKDSIWTKLGKAALAGAVGAVFGALGAGLSASAFVEGLLADLAEHGSWLLPRVFNPRVLVALVDAVGELVSYMLECKLYHEPYDPADASMAFLVAFTLAYAGYPAEETVDSTLAENRDKIVKRIALFVYGSLLEALIVILQDTLEYAAFPPDIPAMQKLREEIDAAHAAEAAG